MSTNIYPTQEVIYSGRLIYVANEYCIQRIHEEDFRPSSRWAPVCEKYWGHPLLSKAIDHCASSVTTVDITGHKKSIQRVPGVYWGMGRYSFYAAFQKFEADVEEYITKQHAHSDQQNGLTSGNKNQNHD